MRAILIDPQNETITEVDCDGTWQGICKVIGSQYMEPVDLNGRDSIYVDEEGSINGKADTGMFRVEGNYPAYLAGKGLVMAVGEEKSIATRLTLEAVRKIVAFGFVLRADDELFFVGHNESWRIER